MSNKNRGLWGGGAKEDMGRAANTPQEVPSAGISGATGIGQTYGLDTMCVAYSADGLKWTQVTDHPLFDRAADTYPCLYHDAPDGSYDAMLRQDIAGGAQGTSWRRTRGMRVLRGPLDLKEIQAQSTSSQHSVCSRVMIVFVVEDQQS